MDLFSAVHEQMDAVRLPLVAVTVTAARRANTPLVAILHWHGFRRASPLVLPGIDIPPRSVPSSAIQLGHAWRHIETIDEVLLDAAWRLGAWDLERVERRGCNMIGTSAGEALACRQAFGDYDGASANETLIDGAPDRGELMQIAADEGYVRWLFRPVKGGVWQALEESDDTLGPDGGRPSPCPVLPIPRQRHGRGRTVYRLGAVHRILLP